MCLDIGSPEAGGAYGAPPSAKECGTTHHTALAEVLRRGGAAGPARCFFGPGASPPGSIVLRQDLVAEAGASIKSVGS
jgi:hypothetical protein